MGCFLWYNQRTPTHWCNTIHYQFVCVCGHKMPVFQIKEYSVHHGAQGVIPGSVKSFCQSVYQNFSRKGYAVVRLIYVYRVVPHVKHGQGETTALPRDLRLFVNVKGQWLVVYPPDKFGQHPCRSTGFPCLGYIRKSWNDYRIFHVRSRYAYSLFGFYQKVVQNRECVPCVDYPACRYKHFG